MQITALMTDETVVGEIGARIRVLRLAEGIAQESLAERAGISVGTLHNLESGRSVQLSSLLRVLRVIGNFAAINDLIPEAKPGPLLQLEMSRLAAKGTRQRAPRRTGGREP